MDVFGDLKKNLEPRWSYKTEVGYCGGKTENTTYQEVCSGNTNHAEVVKINFDPKIISYEEILNFF